MNKLRTHNLTMLLNMVPAVFISIQEIYNTRNYYTICNLYYNVIYTRNYYTICNIYYITILYV